MSQPLADILEDLREGPFKERLRRATSTTESTIRTMLERRGWQMTDEQIAAQRIELLEMADAEAACAACSGDLEECGGKQGRGTILDGALAESGEVRLYLRLCEHRVRALEAERLRLAEERRAELFKASRIPDGTEHMTLESFQPLPHVREALEAAQALVRGRGRKGLVLAGSRGVGKTHLALGITRHLAEQGQAGVEFHVVPDLVDDLKRATHADRGLELIEHLRKARVLVLDDLGRERPTEWWLEQLFRLVNGRELDGTLTVITTNYARPSDLEARLGGLPGQPIVSRIRGMCRWIPIVGPDYRIQGESMFEKGEETS